MNFLVPIMTKLREGLGGKSFPRRVTAPDGSIRWEKVAGKTFATAKEAIAS